MLSSVVLVGTGFGTAFYLFFANRSGKLEAQAVVSRLVVRADWWFTTPAVVIQPASGLLMAHLAGWPLTTPWLALSIGLFLVTGMLWLPVVWLQMRMAAMASAAAEGSGVLPDAYWRYARWWETLGCPAFIAMLAVFYLMVAKPGSWAEMLPF
ncbi:Putative integral membrane protein [Dokdonella koreensis DS-123]|uniref:Integral membrane protein n=1 Tax=Dokdonella koreensis DS-123 TaxID=1300342 RepID=A0A160DWE5_9GAMM|nr:Putative integral membrane protein [Dokdonella koreensis DS-123]